MTLMQKLKEQGWHLTEEGLKKLTSDLQTEDVKKITMSALDWDFKDIAGGALPAKPESNGTIPGRIVLQIQKVRNISAPKANEESMAAPRFLQLELSDGVNSIPALEVERIPNLSLNVPPGTKLHFKSDKLQMMQGFLVLKVSEVQILGGKVEHLVEKWEVARQLLKYARSNRRLSGTGAPPPWIAFEKRMDAHRESLSLDRNLKSLQTAPDKDKNSKENDEFNATRTQAIADASKGGKKKIFGGGQQNMLDHNVKKIMEQGYSEDDATYTLKSTKNNLEKALFSLKKRNNKSSFEGNNTKTTTVAAADGRGSGSRFRGAATTKEEAGASKPQANVTLFEFLTPKIPMTTTSSNTTQTSAQSQPAVNSSQTSRNARETKNPFSSTNISSGTNNNNNNNSNTSSSRDAKALGKFENNMSSSFAANRVTHTPRSDDNRGDKPSSYSQSQRSSNYKSANREERTRANPSTKPNQRGGDRSRTNNDKPINNIQAPMANNNGSLQAGNNSNNNDSQQTSTYSSNSNRRNDRNDRPPRKDREQTQRQSMGSGSGGYQGNKRNQDFKPNENKSYQQRDNNSRGNNDSKVSSNYQQQANNQQPKSNNFDNTMEKLTESTSKMSLQNKKEPYNNSQGRGRHQGGGSSRNLNQNTMQSKSNNNSINNNNQQQQTSQFISSQNFTNKSQTASKQMPSNVSSPQQQQQQQQQTSHTFVTQLPNGYSYDPSKIIGFQSKEANEYAMNLLKSQGLLAQQSSGPTGQQTPMPPPPSHQPQIIGNPQTGAPTAVAYMPQNPNVFVTAQQAPMAQYGMMTGSSWPWNKGDLCLAKYWEDGNYYDAKITAISENTCVVLYMGYGNHEEVLKADCLPITNPSHHPLNAFQAGPPMQQQLAHSYQGAGPTGGGGGSGNQRYRTERPMYVPPPKRGNQNNNN